MIFVALSSHGEWGGGVGGFNANNLGWVLLQTKMEQGELFLSYVLFFKQSYKTIQTDRREGMGCGKGKFQ